jgi:hypothetical protein
VEAETFSLLIRRFDDQDKKLDRIERHVRETNGRVTEIETQRIKEMVARATLARDVERRRRFRATLVNGLLTLFAGGAGAMVLHLVG